MCETEWKWQGGRLVNGICSLSIAEAYYMIIESYGIMVACEGVLIPYNPKYDDIEKQTTWEEGKPIWNH